MTVWAAISWYSAGPIITFNGQISASDYVNIFGNQVHILIQMLFPNRNAIFWDDSSFIHTEVFCLGLRSMKMHFNILPGQLSEWT